MGMSTVALETFCGCLQEYAARQSNPVLDLLDGVTVVEQQHYPAQPLNFATDNWQAFYHCHSQEFRFPGEHGHFHLFHAMPGGEWSHVVGLCMDPEGQPLRWFSVNHWVVGGKWCAAEQLIPILTDTPYTAASTVERWLMAMVALYAEEIATLLRARDAVLADANEDVRQDRQRYILSEQTVELLHKINMLLDKQNDNQDIAKMKRN